jgi:hypothetical protein
MAGLEIDNLIHSVNGFSMGLLATNGNEARTAGSEGTFQTNGGDQARVTALVLEGGTPGQVCPPPFLPFLLKGANAV